MNPSIRTISAGVRAVRKARCRPGKYTIYSMAMGDEADDILASLSFSPDDSNTSTFEVVKDKFDSYFIGTRNAIYERAVIVYLTGLNYYGFMPTVFTAFLYLNAFLTSFRICSSKKSSYIL